MKFLRGESRLRSCLLPFLLLALLLGLGVLIACGDSAPTATTPVTASAPETQPVPAPTARYRVSFQASWSRATHPDRFPSNPHFSPLIGATHAARARFWQAGMVASDGIEAMAELGAISPLDDIIRAAIDSGTAEQLLNGSGISPSPGETSLELAISREFPYVTLVSMIAPSPDWFVGIASENFLESGDWPEEVVFDLLPYDAGTDSGQIFDAPDRDTRPREPISRIDGPPFLNDGALPPLGRFVFTRLAL